jgi:hypothetical protein
MAESTLTPAVAATLAASAPVPSPAPVNLAAPVAAPPANLPTLPPPFIATQRQKDAATRDAACDAYASMTGADPAGVRAALYMAIQSIERGEAVDAFKRKLTGYTLPDSILALAREAGSLNLTLTLNLGAADAAGAAPVTLTATGGNVSAPRQTGGNASPGANRVAGVVSSSSRISAFDAAERGRKAGDNINIVKHDDGSATDTVSGETIPPRGLTAWLVARETTVAANAVGILRKYGQV